MKARITILTALVVGILAMGTGGALAVSSLSTGSTSAQGEYKTDNGGGGFLGEQSSCGNGNSSANGSSGSGSTSGSACTGNVQATRQVSASGSSLPFTGFLAIPVLLLGVGLVGSGVVLRRRFGGDSA